MDHDSDQSDNASSSSFDNRIGYNPFILNVSVKVTLPL